MGFSVSGSTLIILIGLFLSASVLLPVITDSVTEVTTSSKDQQDRLISVKNTNVDYVSSSFNASTDTFAVEYVNSGSEEIALEEIDFLFDGEYTTPTSVVISGSSNREVVISGESVVVEFSTPSKPTRLKAVLPTGQSIITVNP